MIETGFIASWALPQAVHLFWVIAWAVVVIGLTVACVTLLLTRKGRANPLRICIVLSLLVHMLLAGYATTVEIVAASFAGEDEAIDLLVLDEGATLQPQPEAESTPPWERELTDVVRPEPVVAQRTSVSEVSLPQPSLTDAPAKASFPDVAVESHAIDESVASAAEAIDSGAIAEALSSSTAEAQAAEQMEAENVASAEDVDTITPQVTALERMETSEAPAEPGLPSDKPASPLLDAKAVLTQLAEKPATDSTDAVAAGADDLLTAALPATPAPLAALDAALAPPTVSSPQPSNNSSSKETTPQTANVSVKRGIEDVPDTYKARLDPRRGEIAAEKGGSSEAQAAVDAGLAWLALAQSKDGRWDCDYWGGGQEHKIAGSDRYGAGAQADTGVTGLAILAFLGAGHTHQHGEYQATVAAGLSFLMREQRNNGSLAGEAKLFARMYCHGMASFALSEAYAITGDKRLLPAVRLAVNYIVAAQDPRGGGWRYQPGDAGDTSQLGWQVMALKSAELAGIKLPATTQAGVERFLRSVSSGVKGGLASYQPGRPANVAMTAEALVCRQFMAYEPTQAAVSEAADYLVTQLPSADRMNLYYYYYATLALYPLQDARWSAWNAALQKTLLETQRTAGSDDRGSLTGSWDPDTVWGSHGGRAFTTAIATLSLEVYYRYAPTQERAMRAALRRHNQRR